MRNSSFIILIFGILYFIHFTNSIKILDEIRNINSQIENFNAFNRSLKDKLSIKDDEIFNQKLEVKRHIANFEAFNGTDCARCHLEQKLLLPMNDNFVNLAGYIKIVREGTSNMPKYEDRPNKTKKDITDSELRRQYKILKPLFEEATTKGFPTENNGEV